MNRTVLQPEVVRVNDPAGSRWPPLTDEERIRRLRRLAEMMDSAYEIPGTGVRVGLDSLVGLVPVVGDIATALFSLHIVNEARRMGASRLVLMRMLGNVAVDATVGSVPLAGDLFDAAWKANLKNIDILERHMTRRRKKEEKKAQRV